LGFNSNLLEVSSFLPYAYSPDTSLCAKYVYIQLPYNYILYYIVPNVKST